MNTDPCDHCKFLSGENIRLYSKIRVADNGLDFIIRYVDTASSSPEETLAAIKSFAADIKRHMSI